MRMTLWAIFFIFDPTAEIFEFPFSVYGEMEFIQTANRNANLATLGQKMQKAR